VQSLAQLVSSKEECNSCKREISGLRETIVELRAQVEEAKRGSAAVRAVESQLDVEKELRARAEMREEGERKERIAAFAQLLAIQAECTSRIKESELRYTAEKESLNQDVSSLCTQKEELETECQRQRDISIGLSSEIRELKKALEHAEANHEASELLGKATGEIEVLQRKLEKAKEALNSEGVHCADRVAQLEEQLRQGEAQRRRMHNQIQELRGNIRVFARVRPYLPSDSVTGVGSRTSTIDTPTDPTVIVRHDGCGLRIVRHGQSREGGEGGREESFSFSFDKSFGPSASQVRDSFM